MMPVERVLVIGGGFSGMSAAISLARLGCAVDLVEIDPLWRPEGAGISISSATLRALDRLGVYPQVVAAGFVSDGLDVLTPSGAPIATLPTPRAAGADVAGGAGILRADLARILADTVQASGVRCRIGVTYDRIEQDRDGVEVRFTDGMAGRYDLVIGADGVQSSTRRWLFPEHAAPTYLGQVVWRAIVPRPARIERVTMWMGGGVKLGVNPVSAGEMYMFITESRAEHPLPPRAAWAGLVQALVGGFPDPLLAGLLPELARPTARLDVRALSNLLVPRPWNRGRVLLIGDTVAATTPHLASGAGIGIESGIVLAESLAGAATLEAALERFHDRRFARCAMVIRNSEALCRLEMTQGSRDEHARIARESMRALAEAI